MPASALTRLLDEDPAFREAAQDFHRRWTRNDTWQTASLILMMLSVFMLSSGLTSLAMNDGGFIPVIVSGFFLVCFMLSIILTERARTTIAVDFARRLADLEVRRRIQDEFAMDPAEFAAHAAMDEIFTPAMFDAGAEKRRRGKWLEMAGTVAARM